MGTQELTVLAVLIAMVIALATRRVSPTVGVCGALAAMFFLDVLSTDALLSGFANPAPATIASLYVVAGAIERSGALRPLSQRLLTPGAPKTSLARLTTVSALLSSVVANTPIVAMMIGPVRRWARQSGEAPSKYLIPLSYAAVLGGMPTLIGTSTNLVASGIVSDLGDDSYSLFEPARLGLPVAASGIVLVLLLSRRLLPERGLLDGGTSERQFTVSLDVDASGALDGKKVAEAGLRDLGSVYLIAIERGSELITPVHPDFSLESGDRLTFAGRVDDIVPLESLNGLSLAEESHVAALDDGQHSWFEAVVGASSPLLGQSIKQSGFRDRYQAAVVAINRSGEDIDGSLGTARLRVGDSLLLIADDGFKQRWRYRADFLLIEQRKEPPPTAAKAAARALLVLLGVVIAALAGVGVLKAALLGAVATVVTGALTPRQARDSIDINVVVLVAAAIGLGAGVQASGLATRLADGMVDATSSGGTWAVAFGIVATTLLLTEVLTNAGAVALMVPIAYRVAEDVNGDPRLFALGVTVAASASFLTPIGYQTNTMIYGPGRYRFSDYLRLGIPITVMVLILVPTMITAGRGLW